MKRLLLITLLLITTLPLFSYKIFYLEQFYKLYSEEFYSYPNDVYRNIDYLKAALSSPYANPLNALGKVESKIEFEKYRYVVYTHICLKIVDNYLMIANGLDKQKAYFYNAPFKKYNIESLNMAEWYYKEALKYWDDALSWSDKASDEKFRFIHLEDLEYFEDEVYMIQTGELDYQEIINKHLKRVNKVREEFENMDENTY